MLLGGLNSHFALLSTLSDWAYFSSSYFIAYNLLYIHSISFFQASGMLPVFVFSIWDLDVQKCYKIEDVLYQHKSFEKIPLQQSNLIGSAISETDAHGKRHIPTSIKIIPLSEA